MNTYNLLDKYNTKIEIGFKIIYYRDLINNNVEKWLVKRVTKQNSLICEKPSGTWTEISYTNTSNYITLENAKEYYPEYFI